MQKPNTTTGGPPLTREDRSTQTHTEDRGGSLDPASPPDPHQNPKDLVEKREQALDDALDDTFPGSDPVSFTPKAPDKPKR